MTKPLTIDDYIAAQADSVQPLLQCLRETIARTAPNGVEVISYGMPAVKCDGRILLYYAAWKNHYALYPGRGGFFDDLESELAPYKLSKGTIQFPLDSPVPVKLIEHLVQRRLNELAEKSKRSRKKASDKKT